MLIIIGNLSLLMFIPELFVLCRPEHTDSSEEYDGHCVVDYTFSEQNRMQDGVFLSLFKFKCTFINVDEDMVSVAQSTLPMISIYERLNEWKKVRSKKIKTKLIKMNPIIVPTLFSQYLRSHKNRLNQCFGKIDFSSN